ncbi:DUF523 domain-containing protein [uncultured Megasphaera sp.]|uniref:DUF523 domain-containing protein n=1 Tax=uncultured Megasphaera sp. TaxID=165188 RepID=UPI00258F7912|nr:DUF523 domain-containing protein [uncultured Megasphaera sp.]
MKHILISACLLGQACRYDGQSKTYAAIENLWHMPDVTLIPFCPEQGGGLPTPRPASKQQGDRVVTETGADVTEEYERGADQALRLARLYSCTWAVLKEKSPSCGSGEIYDGTFSRTLTAGDGVTAARLKAAGIRVVGEKHLQPLLAALRHVGV